jgi:stress response protein SCP2
LTGDEAAAEEDADERIELRLAKLPRAVASMLFVVTAYAEKSSFVDMKSAFVGLFDPVEGEMCRYAFDCKGDHTGLVMCRVARSGPAWVLNAIGDVAAGPRDYGTWVPELKAYLSDLVSHVRVGDPNDRVAIMHKGSVVDLSYYQAGPLAEVRMGVAWDITGGRSIDLDASCLLLKAGCSEATTEIVSYQKLSSSDGRVRHSGDDTTGDGGGDDEVITVELDKLAPDVRYVAFVVNSYSGQPFSQVDNVSCHLFLPPSRARPKPQDLAIFNLSSKTYHTTALVMTILVRSTRPDGSPTWLMRAVGEGTEAKVAKQCLDEIQLVLTGAKERDF